MNGFLLSRCRLYEAVPLPITEEGHVVLDAAEDDHRPQRDDEGDHAEFIPQRIAICT